METDLASPMRKHIRLNGEITPELDQSLDKHPMSGKKINTNFFKGRNRLQTLKEPQDLGIEIMLPKRFTPVQKAPDDDFLEIRMPKKPNPIVQLPLEPIEKTDSNLNSESENEV